MLLMAVLDSLAPPAHACSLRGLPVQPLLSLVQGMVCWGEVDSAVSRQGQHLPKVTQGRGAASSADCSKLLTAVLQPDRTALRRAVVHKGDGIELRS